MRESTLLIAALLVACNQADLRTAPDGSPDPEDEPIATRDCPDAAFSRCDAMAPGAGGCTGEPEADGGAARISADVSWPPGCVVNVPSTYVTALGECLVAYACTCRRPGRTDGGASQWSCVR